MIASCIRQTQVLHIKRVNLIKQLFFPKLYDNILYEAIALGLIIVFGRIDIKSIFLPIFLIVSQMTFKRYVRIFSLVYYFSLNKLYRGYVLKASLSSSDNCDIHIFASSKSPKRIYNPVCILVSPSCFSNKLKRFPFSRVVNFRSRK